MSPKLVITVDTEEDLWAEYRREGNPVENIGALPMFQELAGRYGAIPTYLVNWAVTDGAASSRTLRSLVERGDCEIGMHCHPWNTPPFEEPLDPYHSMLCSLPAALVARKLENLHARIVERVGVVPVTFRAGRWGFSESVGRSLQKLGYAIDTSVSPGVDWTEDHGPDYTNAPLASYRFDPSDYLTPAPSGPLLEVPATIGFWQGHHALRLRIRKALLASPAARGLRLPGILDRARLLNFGWLSPEPSDAASMIRIARRALRNGARTLNLCFHSTSLVPGLSPFVRTSADLADFLQRIEVFLRFAAESGIVFSRLSDATEC
jgi:hypothetical protein